MGYLNGPRKVTVEVRQYGQYVLTATVSLKVEGLASCLCPAPFLLVPAREYVGKFLATFKEFPQRQKVGSFSLDQVLENLQSPTKAN